MNIIKNGIKGKIIWTEMDKVATTESRNFCITFISPEELPVLMNMFTNVDIEILKFISMLDTGKDNTKDIDILKNLTFKDSDGKENPRFDIHHNWINIENPLSTEIITTELFKLNDNIYGTNMVVSAMEPDVEYAIMISIPMVEGKDILDKFDKWTKE